MSRSSEKSKHFTQTESDLWTAVWLLTYVDLVVFVLLMFLIHMLLAVTAVVGFCWKYEFFLLFFRSWIIKNNKTRSNVL